VVVDEFELLYRNVSGKTKENRKTFLSKWWPGYELGFSRIQARSFSARASLLASISVCSFIVRVFSAAL
jgi:hypothetical protein